MKRFEDIFSRFLLSPEYSVHRNLVFIVVHVVIFTDIVIKQPGYGRSLSRLIFGMLFYNVAIIGTQYMNLKLAVPRWLMKHQYLKYILFITSMTALILGVLILFQYYFYTLLEHPVEIPRYFLTLNIISSTIILLLMYAGCATFTLLRQWMLSSRRITELESATLNSELRYLKNQINPHFLFNTLNNAHTLFRDNKKEASALLNKLEDLLRYQINESSKDEIYLTSDISFLTDYLNLEKVRRDRFSFSIRIDGEIDCLKLPPLLFIPFVENAVKHSQDSDQPSYINVQFRVSDRTLFFRCGNSVAGGIAEAIRPGGIGLKNISRRLELLFPGRHQLQLSEEETKYIVDLQISL